MELNNNSKTEWTQNLYMMKLLFTSEPDKPDVEVIEEALRDRFGEVDAVTGEEKVTAFAIKSLSTKYNNKNISPELVVGEVREFDSGSIDEIGMSQLWNVEDGEKVLKNMKYEITICDMLTFSMPYKKRCDMLMDWLEVAVNLFVDCEAVWMPTAGKLFIADQIRFHNIPKESRFVYFGVNARYFKVSGKDECIVDTMGLSAMNLPDVQYHFKELDPNDVTYHAYNVAAYIYEENSPIKNGDNIDGLFNGAMSQYIQWRCQYEEALIGPSRIVMDICPGEYAAGER